MENQKSSFNEYIKRGKKMFVKWLPTIFEIYENGNYFIRRSLRNNTMSAQLKSLYNNISPMTGENYI